MGFLIYKGWRTTTSETVPTALSPTNNMLIDTYVSVMPSHKKPAMRSTEYYVKGRDGALNVHEGFENFKLEATLVLINANVQRRLDVNAWADYTGKLITSDDLTKCYRAAIRDEVVWDRVKANSGFYDTCTITWDCDPYTYAADDGEASSRISITQTGTLTNPGTAKCFPLIQVNGSGDVSFTIAGMPIEIDDMTAGVPVYIDCETGYVYTSTGATAMRGETPVLQVGNNTIIFGENLTSLVLTPHWRWL